MGNTNNLLFASSSDSNQSNNVLTVLNSIGYNVRDLTNIVTPNIREITSYRALILLVGSTKYQTQENFSFIHSITEMPKLLLVEDKLESNDNPIVKCCDEFALWPCHREELVLRLSRVANVRSMNKSDSSDNMDEFIGLNLLGKSQAFLNVLDRIKKFARSDACVLIEGETGTGKELAARAIHYLSVRKNEPFIPVNCGALPDNLIENELFGHEKGAYTDAKERQQGLLEQASGGTLFLDEVNSLSLKAQITLLRFLQDQRFLPIGSRKYKQVDTRVVAATNQSLEELVKSGVFRQDLYYRLNIMYVHMPSLKERKGDEILLAEEFMRRYRRQYDDKNKILHKDLVEWLGNYDWPGNVRELENFIHRQFLLAEGPYIERNHDERVAVERRHMKGDRRQHDLFNVALQEAKCRVISEFEEDYLNQLMKKSNGNVTLAAKMAGKERRALGKLLKKYFIQKI